MHLTAGIGLKPVHYEAALACDDAGLWLEVHPENYMVDGGPRLAWLSLLRERHPLSLHGVGMSLASPDAPEPAHLERLAMLVDRFEPALVSEHLAWSRWGTAHFPDLLPLPRSASALFAVAANIGHVQDRLKRAIAIENPTHYLPLDHELDEVDFLVELSRRSGCMLLVDVNNVFVSARNVGIDSTEWLDRVPGDRVTEIHLAGQHADPTYGESLLIDSHDAPVAEPVWSLYERLVARIGPRPTLIERDDNLPGFDDLRAERRRAHRQLQSIASAPTLPRAA
ncbi:MAG: DUF692 domain-containing protein [Burkholderiaceae bacterium]|nr:DUF692 domain-containing protein [Burkholderiaceae bacterium]